jgi:basic membrane protein A
MLGIQDGPHAATYFGRIYEARYLSGVVAGKMTTSNLVGYVAAHPIPEVIRGINAFTMGVRSVNPGAKVRVVWTNTWYDPVKEREAAVALLDAGADIIAQHQDTVEPQKAAQERAIRISYNTPKKQFAPGPCCRPVWNRAPTTSRGQGGHGRDLEDGLYWGPRRTHRRPLP